MTITSRRDDEKNLTVFTAEGELTFEDQMTVLREFYGADPTANVIWDFRAIEGNRVSADELRMIVRFIKQREDKRPRGRTALVAASNLDYGLSRMSDMFAEHEDLPWTIKPFRSMEEAVAWIEEP